MVRALLIVSLLETGAAADCVGEACPVQGSALLQAKRSSPALAQAPQEEDEAPQEQDEAQAFAQAFAGSGNTSLLEEVRAKFRAHKQETGRESVQAAPYGEYHICIAKGGKGQKCMNWPPPSGPEFCWDHYFQNNDCQRDCGKDMSLCSEGGRLAEVCSCSDLTTAAGAACEGKSAGAECSFESGTLENKDGDTTKYKYSSICGDREGALACAPLVMTPCFTGRGSSLKQKPDGTPCVNVPGTTSSGSGNRKKSTEKRPTLSYCEPGTGNHRCKSGSNPSVPAELQGKLDEDSKKFWSGVTA